MSAEGVSRALVHLLKGLVHALAAAAALAVAAMVLITCGDIVLRLAGHPIVGVYDIVRVAGGLTIACALPYTTAVKGHVAIEYFFQKLGPRGRVAVDSAVRLVGLALWSVLTWQYVRYGFILRRSGEVTSTLQLPVFWIPWVFAASFATVFMVTLYHLLHPGRSLLKP